MDAEATYQFRVRPHPLGVVVFEAQGERGELLIPGEACCGVSVAELQRIADTNGVVTVPVAAAADCPLSFRRGSARRRPLEPIPTPSIALVRD